MIIRIKLYAMLSSHLPAGAKRNESDLTVPADETVEAVLRQLHLPANMCHLVLVNGSYIAPGERVGHKLVEGDHLAVWPPVAGG